ncbi:AAA family ATPase [Planotetraspora sp. A-T 1434]|uniref:AAA family ATPase n=1 Tax=Planotetraspora sp. A-T 1434 TaxID=2979219 RepID=UPI0021C14E31|nr:ATP-binding protein [Planotetraspora sp. A-T 1434]MCT9931376.1 AAA family ATPase [Planotetraspora sp. A-T 1434]
MITRIEIDGFKSFLDFALDVPPFLAVIGRNASGKSNLLDALVFAAAVARGDRLLDAVVSARGDATSLFHRRADGTVVDRMRFALEFSLSREDLDARSPEEDAGYFPTSWRYEVELRLVPQPRREVLRVVSEVFSPFGSPRFPENGRRFPPPAVQVATRSRDHLLIPDRERQVGEYEDNYLDWVPGSICAEELNSVMVLRLEPTELARPSPLGHEVTLSPVGAGLAGYLQGIVEATVSEDHPEGVLPLIKARLTRLVREVTDFDLVTDPHRGDVRLRFASRHHTGFEADQASDGTLRILAVLAALYDPRRRGLLAVEEPENGVFPERLRDLIEITRQEVHDRDWLRSWRAPNDEAGAQVLVTSHSPVLLDVVPRDEIVLLDNATRVGGGVAPSAVTRPRRLAAVGEVPQRDASGVPVVAEAELERFRVAARGA